MSTHAGLRTEETNYSAGAVGVTIFAAVLMMISGTLHVVEGIVALVNDNFYYVGKDYVFQFDLTSWGWFFVITGTLVGLAGVGLLQGAVWARTVAVIMASIGILSNFAWMPHYPLWSITLIAFNVFVIWAVTAHGRDILEP